MKLITITCQHCGHGTIYSSEMGEVLCVRCKRKIVSGGLVIPAPSVALGLGAAGANPMMVRCERHVVSWDQTQYLRCPRCVDDEQRRDLADALAGRAGYESRPKVQSTYLYRIESRDLRLLLCHE